MFRFSSKSRRRIRGAIEKSIGADANQAAVAKYISRAEASINAHIGTVRGLNHAKDAAGPGYEEAVKLADQAWWEIKKIIRIFDEVCSSADGVAFYHTLTQGSPLYLFAKELDQRFKALAGEFPEIFAALSPERAQEGRKPRPGYDALLVNLRAAAPSERWEIIEATLTAYEHDRLAGNDTTLPSIPPLTGDAKRRARDLARLLMAPQLPELPT